MTEEEHVSVVEMLLDTAAILRRTPSTALASGELVWGAVIHSCAVLSHRHRAGGRPRHPRQGKDLEKLLTEITDDDAIRASLFDGLDITQKRLHNHFYTGQLSDERLQQYLTIGVDFVRQLLRIVAQSPAADGSTAV